MKEFLITGLIVMMMTAMAGCGVNVNVGDKDLGSKDPNDAVVFNNSDDVNSVDATDDEDFYVSPTDAYAVGETINVGEIIMFDGDRVHILSGDLIGVYKYDNSNDGTELFRDSRWRCSDCLP